MSTASSHYKPARKQLLLLGVGLLAIYVILPQLTSFKHGFAAIWYADRVDLLCATLLIIVSYFFAAATYCFLASQSLKYSRTVLLQFAATFINRLLPAGIGGMGVNYAYLRKNGHTTGAAGSVVAINNLLGFLGHALIVVVAASLLHPHLPTKHLSSNYRLVLAVAGSLLMIAALAIAVRRFGPRIRRTMRQIIEQLTYYRRHPLRLSAGLLSSICLTLAVVVSFWFCIHALGGGLSFMTALLVFSFGFAIGSVTPTPGGLGGVEAGLVAGLVAYGLPGGDALATALAYRLISYWFTTAVGAIAFIVCTKKSYI